MTKLASAPKPPWLETMAEVTACKYEFGAGQALAFGIPSSKRFRISFTYYAHGKTCTGEFSSRTYMEQGKTFTITYNPLNPEENSKSAATPLLRTPLFAIGVMGSIILSLLWLAILRGCS